MNIAAQRGGIRVSPGEGDRKADLGVNVSLKAP